MGCSWCRSQVWIRFAACQVHKLPGSRKRFAAVSWARRGLAGLTCVQDGQAGASTGGRASGFFPIHQRHLGVCFVMAACTGVRCGLPASEASVEQYDAGDRTPYQHEGSVFGVPSFHDRGTVGASNVLAVHPGRS